VDGYYAKKEYIDAVMSLDLHAMTTLRSDADCWLLYTGPHPKRKRARRKDDGKVNGQDLRRFDALGCETDRAFPCTGHAYAVVILRERFYLQQPWRPPESLPLIAEDLTAYRITLSRKPVLCWWRCVSWSLLKRLGKW